MMFQQEDISALVFDFYVEVQKDPMLAPVFAERVTDWDPHLKRMCSFWETVLGIERSFVPGLGGPPAVHRHIAALTPAHFDRWLLLFKRSAHQTLNPEQALHVIAMSQRMAVTLSAHLRDEAAS